MNKLKKIQVDIWKTNSKYKLDLKPNGSKGTRIKIGFLPEGEARSYLNHKIVAYSNLKEWKLNLDDNKHFAPVCFFKLSSILIHAES